jgi:DNA repair protein RadC
VSASLSVIQRYRLQLVPETEDYGPADARDSAAVAAFLYRVVEPFRHHEIGGALFVDCDYRIVGHTMPHRGIYTSVLIEPRQIFVAALLVNAAGVILYHNHPATDVQPSSGDILVTERMRDAGEILGIRLLDHLIVGTQRGRFTSLRKSRRVVLFDFGAVVRIRDLQLEPLSVDGRRKVQPKYCDPATGETWSGRGNMARWLRRKLRQGFTLEDFRIRA